MKIVALTAENVKKLRAVEIRPDGSIVQITGRNGSGKSSVLDSIYYALAGAKDLPRQPIRKGEQSARVRLDLGELIVTRRFTPSGSTLTVEGANGARFPSPQRMLDDLIGAISFDPLAFSRMESRAQFDTLRKVAKLDVDIDALNGLNLRDYDARTEVNRRAKSLRAQAAAITVPADLPAAPVDISALLAEMQMAGDQNAQLEKRRANREQAERNVEAMTAKAHVHRQSVAGLRRQADAEEAKAIAADKQAESLAKKLADAPPLPEPIDTSAMVKDIEAGRRLNGQIEQRGLERSAARHVREFRHPVPPRPTGSVGAERPSRSTRSAARTTSVQGSRAASPPRGAPRRAPRRP
jgi:energy-coupling factor transporter ATP-binding protein EcfA2